MSIKSKFFIYTMSVVIILVGSLALYNIEYQKNLFLNQKVNDIKFFIQGFSIPVLDSLISNDYSGINTMISNMKLNIKINTINVYNNDRICVASNNPHELNKKVINSHIINIFNNKKGINYKLKREIIIAEPIFIKNILYGVLEIRMPISAINAISKEYTKNIIIFLILCIIVGIVLSYTVANHISENIKRLIIVAKKLASGNFKDSIDVKTNDEFGILGKIFNKAIFNMNIMFNTIQKINFSSPSDELLDVIMDNIIMALNAERISILYFDDKEKLLKLNKVRGLRESVVETSFLKPGEGIAGRVFSTGIPEIVNKGYASDKFKKFESSRWKETKVRNIMCVPITVNSNIIGVVNVINKNSEEGFDEFDLKLLQALIVHISTAISKSSMYNEAIMDGLTGLYIKSYFFSRLEEEAFRAKRYGQALSVMCINIDDFSKLNEEHGHLECDLLLMNLGRMIKNNIRLNIDIPARFEKDEFVLILPETDFKKAVLFAERLRAKIASFMFPLETGDALNLTVSIGVAQFNEKEDISELIKNMEEALKISKQKGKNRVTLSEKI